MLPIKALLFGGASELVVDFINRTGHNFDISPADVSTDYVILDTGTELLTGTAGRTWLLQGVAADCEILAHIASGPGAGANTTGSSAFDSWLSASSTIGWIITRTANTSGTSTLVLEMQCRRASDSVVIANWTITLEAEVAL